MIGQLERGLQADLDLEEVGPLAADLEALEVPGRLGTDGRPEPMPGQTTCRETKNGVRFLTMSANERCRPAHQVKFS